MTNYTRRGMQRSYLKYIAEKLLQEATKEKGQSIAKKSGDSLDSQVDKLLQSYVNKDFDPALYAENVQNLVENYDNLLEFRSTLIKRSVNFIAKNKDQSTAAEVNEYLRSAGYDSDRTKKETVADDTTPPAADRAGPGGAG